MSKDSIVEEIHDLRERLLQESGGDINQLMARLKAEEAQDNNVYPCVTDDNREARLRRFLEQELWPIVPADQLGRRLSRDEEEAILGYGSEGV